MAADDEVRANAITDSLERQNPDLASNSENFLSVVSSVEGSRGRLENASRRIEEYLDGNTDASVGFHSWLTTMRAGHALTLGDSARARRILQEAEDGYDLDSIDPLDRPYTDLASAYAMVGDGGSAERLLGDRDTDVPDEFRRFDEWEARDAGAAARLAEGDYDGAIEMLRGLPRIECWGCLVEARAHDRAGRPDEAIESYEQYLATSDLFGIYDNQFSLAETLERLAALYDERGDGQNAVRHYARFVELWSEADGALQPRVAAAQNRLEEILREIG